VKYPRTTGVVVVVGVVVGEVLVDDDDSVVVLHKSKKTADKLYFVAVWSQQMTTQWIREVQ